MQQPYMVDPNSTERHTPAPSEQAQCVALQDLVLDDSKEPQNPAIVQAGDPDEQLDPLTAFVEDGLVRLDASSDSASPGAPTPASSSQGTGTVAAGLVPEQVDDLSSNASESNNPTPESTGSSLGWDIIRSPAPTVRDDILVDFIVAILRDILINWDGDFRHAPGQVPNDSGASLARSTPTQSGQTSLSNQAGKRKRNDEAENKGDSHKPKKSRGTRQRHRESKATQKHLACPFFKKDRQLHSRCRAFGGTKISYVKTHIYKNHYWHCYICKEYFQNAEDRNQHIQRRDCQHRPGRHGITDMQKALLGNPARAKAEAEGKEEEAYWLEVWDIIFPWLKDQKPKSVWKEDACEEMVQFITGHDGQQIVLQHLRGHPLWSSNLENSLEPLINDALRQLAHVSSNFARVEDPNQPNLNDSGEEAASHAFRIGGGENELSDHDSLAPVRSNVDAGIPASSPLLSLEFDAIQDGRQDDGLVSHSVEGPNRAVLNAPSQEDPDQIFQIVGAEGEQPEFGALTPLNGDLHAEDAASWPNPSPELDILAYGSQVLFAVPTAGVELPDLKEDEGEIPPLDLTTDGLGPLNDATGFCLNFEDGDVDWASLDWEPDLDQDQFGEMMSWPNHVDNGAEDALDSLEQSWLHFEDTTDLMPDRPPSVGTEDRPRLG